MSTIIADLSVSQWYCDKPIKKAHENTLGILKLHINVKDGDEGDDGHICKYFG